MERSQILDMMGALKLFGMRSAYDEIMASGIKRQHQPPGIVGDLLQSEIAEKQARSILREELLIHGIRPLIPPKANRKNPPACDFRAYKGRNRIERMFNHLKQFRRVATRYDKTRKSFSAFLALAAAKIWLPHFVNRT